MRTKQQMAEQASELAETFVNGNRAEVRGALVCCATNVDAATLSTLILIYLTPDERVSFRNWIVSLG